jgi:hypothetical protein
MSRRNKEPSTKPEKPVPEKRAKASRNPLRRNSMIQQNMQQIPSPNASMTELADTSSGHQPSHEQQPSLSRTASADHSQSNKLSNGDNASTEAESSTNGTAVLSPLIHERRTRPPSTILEEVRSILLSRVS